MIECRKATVGDAYLLAATRRIVWEETYRGIYPDEMLDEYDMDAYAKQDRERLSDIRHQYYLYLQGKECVGYFSFGPYNYGTYKDFSLCLNNLYIRRDWKGLGLGKQAFACIRAYCRNRGIAKFFCGCNVHNRPAMNFYSHMGGTIGNEPSFHENKSDDIIHYEFYTGE